MLNCKKTMIKKINYNSVRRYPHLEIFIPNKNHGLLDTPLISIWIQRAENQKFNIEENVMSERVKMPNRHFLRSDYLHIFFYIKFLVFVSLVHQISIFIFRLKYYIVLHNASWIRPRKDPFPSLLPPYGSKALAVQSKYTCCNLLY